MRGEEVGKRLYDMGFQKLFLVTGHEADKFEDCFWIREIRGKDPPNWRQL